MGGAFFGCVGVSVCLSVSVAVAVDVDVHVRLRVWCVSMCACVCLLCVCVCVPNTKNECGWIHTAHSSTRIKYTRGSKAEAEVKRRHGHGRPTAGRQEPF